MANQKKRKALAVYLAVILLVFALCVPVLHQKIKQKFLAADLKPSPPTIEITEGTVDLPLSPEAPSLPEIPSSVADSTPELKADLSQMVWPLKGQVLRGVGLSYAQTFSDYRYHDGLDIQAARGAEVVAALSGIVISKEMTKEEGVRLVLDHGQGWVSVYSHLEEAYLQEDNYCNTGDPLGTVNQPGLQEILEGPHLHFTLRQDDQIVNPLDYLPEIR